MRVMSLRTDSLDFTFAMRNIAEDSCNRVPCVKTALKTTQKTVIHVPVDLNFEGSFNFSTLTGR